MQNKGEVKLIEQYKQVEELIGYLLSIIQEEGSGNRERILFGYQLFHLRKAWGISQELIDEWIKQKWIRIKCKGGCGYMNITRGIGGKSVLSAEGELFTSEIKNPTQKVDSN